MSSSHDKGAPSGPGRARRALAAVAKTAALGVVFALAATGGVLLHVGLAAPRRFATARVNEILAGSFKGKITIQRVGLLHLTRLDGVDAEVLDPDGKRVLYAYGVRAQLGTFALLRSLAGGDRMVMRIPELTINGAEVVLEEDATGTLTLQRAFESRQPPSEGPGAEVSIPEITLGHAWVHGHLSAVPLVDADLKDLAAAFASTPETTDLEIRRLSVRGRGLPGMNPEGAVVGSMSLPADPADETRVSARYEGRVGDIPVNANGSLTGKEVSAVVDVPETAPEAFTALAPGQVRFGAPVSAHAEVHGALPVLNPVLRARVGEGEITASGTVTLPEKEQTDTVASANLNVKNLDVSLLRGDAPRSRLTATVDTSVVSRPGGKVSGTFELANQVGEVSGQVVPAVNARGEFSEKSVRGSARIAERGVPATVRFSLDPREGGASPNDLTFDAEATIPNLDEIPRLGSIGRGRAHVRVQGRLDLDTKRISAKAAGETTGLDIQGVRLARGFLTVDADGPLESPHLVAKVRGAGMRAGGYAFTSVDARVSGSPQELDVFTRLVGDGQSPTAAARAHVTLREDIAVRGARVELTREEVTSTVKVASVRAAGGAVDVRGVRVEGLGDPIEATARISEHGVTVKARGDGVDLSRLATLLGREEDARGHLAFDVDATASRRGARGRVEARIADLSVRSIDKATVRVATSIEGTRVSGAVFVSLGDVGRLEVSAPAVELGGSVMEVSSWEAATGTIAIDGLVNLGRLMAQFPEESRPVAAAGGLVSIRGKASRSSRSASPGVELEVSTKGLLLVEKQEKVLAEDGSLLLAPEPRRTVGLDGDLAVKLDASSGGTQVSAKLHDEKGPLVSLDARARLPIAEIWRSPDRLLGVVSTTPIEARVAVPRRSLDALPPALGGLPPVKGDIELTADLQGTARAPKVTLKAKGTSLLPRGAARCVRTVDLEADVVYDGQKADVHLVATRDGREVMGTNATVKVSVEQALSGGALAWEASGDVALSSFPLDTVGALARQPIAGAVSGKVSVVDLHRAAKLDVDLDLRGLSLDHTTFPNGEVKVAVNNGSFNVSARLDQSDGHAETTATGAVTWGGELSPALDLTRPIEVAIRAKNFRADAAMPFVQGIFSELDGRIDTDARLHVAPGGKDGSMDGAVVIRDGVFEVPQIGERFHNLRGRVIMKPWGTLRFEDFSAEAPTGKIAMKAEAVLKGLQLQSALATVSIPKGQSVPITVEGVPMGRAFGDITTRAKMTDDGKRLDVNVDIPVLHVALPQSTGHAVQPLERDKTVRVGVHSNGDFVSIPLAPPEEPRAPSDTRIHAAINLGNDVEVRRDTTVNVVLQGRILVEVNDKTRVTGQIRIVRGKLELQGKQFIIDRGVVSFVGPDPSNPTIVATAYWDGPEGIRVYADFSGQPTSGKLSLRSEPSLSQDEILALILFGSPDGSFGADAPPGQGASTGVKAAGIAGGVVTQGLNKAISGITSVDIATRIDTSKADSPRPELAVQISRSVSARLGYKLGVPAPGENPDRTELTLDWRFVRNWSLVTTVGDQGSTAVDLVWRLRY